MSKTLLLLSRFSKLNKRSDLAISSSEKSQHELNTEVLNRRWIAWADDDDDGADDE